MLVKKLYFISIMLILQGCSKSNFVNGTPRTSKDKKKEIQENPTVGTPGTGAEQEQTESKDLNSRSADASSSKRTMNLEYHGLTKRIESIKFKSDTMTLSDLNSLTPTVSQTTQQINRPVGEKQIKFPYNGSTASETFSKNNLGIADIVLVIDNSPSMREIQEKVAGKLATLTSYFGQADWSLKLVTTDASESCNQFENFTAKTPDYAQLFYDSLLSVGVLGSVNERGVYKASKALTCKSDSTQATWLRPHSNIAVIFVSDEDNCSTGTCFGKDDDPENDPEALLTLLESPLGGSKRSLKYSAKTYGIIAIPGVDCDSSNVTGGATEYHNLIARTSTGAMESGQLNETEDICATDYTTVFNRISKDISENLQKVFTLKHYPDMHSVSVTVNNTDLSLNTDFEIIGNQIIFKNDLPDQADIKVDYSYGKTDPSVQFQISDKDVIIESIEMKSPDGSMVTPDHQIQNGMLTLSQVPAFDSELKIVFRDSLPQLNHRFKLENPVINPESILVFENNEAKSVSWDPESNEIIFEQAPSDNATIEIRYQTSLERTNKIKIPESIDLSRIQSITLKSPSVEKDVTFSPESGIINIDLTEFSEPGSLELIIDLAQFENGSVHPLSEIPFLENIELIIERQDQIPETCEDFTYQQIEGKPGIIIHCPYTASDRISVRYFKKNSTPVEIETTFEDPDQLEWSVFINNKQFDDWTRVGGRIIIAPEILGVIAIIRIETITKN